ncbi:MAG: 3-phosphoshikimate 1-carboxyvinyltransferase [Chitinivibrionales bacterium]
MKWMVRRSSLKGTLRIPPSKSHTIRGIVCATLARGESTLEGALLEGDGWSALQGAQALGAEYTRDGTDIRIRGIGEDYTKGEQVLDLGNSGTATRLLTAVAALGNRARTFTGDDSLKTRPMRPMLDALRQLGASYSVDQDRGDIPFTITGPIRGGDAVVSGISSQFVSGLLCACPCAKDDCNIRVENLHEKPYVGITLWWLDRMGIRYEASEDLSTFSLPGNQRYKPFTMRIPGDFSSATFGAVAAAITGSAVRLDNLDFTDPQGDRQIFDVLAAMGASLIKDENGVTVSGKAELHGCEIDLNDMPDALPAFAVLGCVAKGKTVIRNVAQARIKETDRIAVMAGELAAMGARVEELPDGMIIHQSSLQGASVRGHHDHRVVMALALAGLIARGETLIDTAEAARVTYPSFLNDFKALGADITANEE